MHVSWQVKCLLIRAFPLVFDIQRINCQHLEQIEIYLDHQYSESVSNKNVALHWRRNSCPGATLIFLVFSCWAIWRVITCSPLTLRQCFINTPQHLLSFLQKHYQTPVHNVAYGHSFLLHIKSPALHKYLSPLSLLKSSKFLIPQFLVKCCKLHSVFKILLKSHMLDIFLVSYVHMCIQMFI